MFGGRRSFRPLWLAATLAAAIPALTAGAARAEEFAGAVPADALIHIEWHGLPADDKPALSVAALIDVIAQAGDAPAEEREAAVALGEIVDWMLTTRCSVTLLDVAMSDAGPDVPVLLMARAGDRAAEFAGRFEKLIAKDAQNVRDVQIGGGAFKAAQMPDLPMPLVWGAHDGLFIVGLGERSVAVATAEATARGPALLANEEFTHVRAAMAESGERLVFSMYVNPPGLISRGQTIAQAMMGGELPPLVDKVLEETGINGVRGKGLQCSITADGTWRIAAYAHAPRPRKGILECWEQRPLTDADFAFVPADAYFMEACTWDVDRSFKNLLDTLARIDPGYPPMLSNVYNMSLGMFGVHPVDDLIAKLGDTWVAYDAPSHGGLLCLGSVVVMGARDAAGLHQSLDTIAGRAAKMAAEHGVKFEAKRITCGGHEMTRLAFSGVPVPVAPSWGVIGDRVVAGLFPQMVAAAMDEIQSGPRPGPLSASADFKAMRARLPKDAQALSYLDDKTILRWIYPIQLFVAHALSSGLSESGLSVDTAAIPTLEHELAATPNSMGAVSSDDDGIHYVMMAPGSSLFRGVATLAGVTSVLAPALENAKRDAGRARSLANLRNIGQACMIYANDELGKFPPDLQKLIEIQYLTQKSLHSPLDESGEVSYVYVTGQTEMFNPQHVIAYERPDLADETGISVLLGDGHVERMPLDRLKELLRETYGALGRSDELPEWVE